MKILVITALCVGFCWAQGPPRRPYNQIEDDKTPHQYQDTPRQSQQPHHQPPPQLHQQQHHQQQQESHPRAHESTTYIPIIRFEKEQGEEGTYKALWETGNNILAQEEGFLKDLGPDPDPDNKGQNLHAQVQRGSYIFTAPNGETIHTIYTADENGFHVEGDHLPTPPPVSPEVQKGLDLIYAGIRAQEEEDARQGPQQRNQAPPEDNRPQYRPQEDNRPQYRPQEDNRQQYRQA